MSPTWAGSAMPCIVGPSGNEPRCLWNTGVIPKGMCAMEPSPHMKSTEDLPAERRPDDKGVRKVYTDGSALRAGTTVYAGWGVYDPEGVHTCHGPLIGVRQSADRAEVRALVQVAEAATSPVVVVSDNRYTVDTANRIICGDYACTEANQDLWDRFKANKRGVHNVEWIKSHMTPEQALEKGFSEDDRKGNEEADGLAKRRAEEHGYTGTQIGRAKRELGLARRVQDHLARSYVKYLGCDRVNDYFKECRRKKKTYERTKRIGRPPVNPASKGHDVRVEGSTQYCHKCGRVTKSKNPHKFWINHKCEPLEMVERYKSDGHRLELGGRTWTCARCGLEGRSMYRIQCEGGKRRGLSQRPAGDEPSAKRARRDAKSSPPPPG